MPCAFPTQWRRLIGWIFYNPFDLHKYIETHIIHYATPNVADLAPWQLGRWQDRTHPTRWFQWWRTNPQMRIYAADVILMITFFLVIIELGGASLSIFWLPPADVGINTLLSLLVGVGIVLVCLFIGAYTGDIAIFTIWGIHFGLGLPLLFLHERWIRQLTMASQANIWVLLEFSVFCGLFFGVTLNSYTHAFIRQISYWFVHLAIVFLIPFLGIMTLYYRQFLDSLGMWPTVVCIIAAIIAMSLGILRIDDYLIALYSLPSPREVRRARSTLTTEQQHELHDRLYHAIPRVTLLMPRKLRIILEEWLEANWRQGLCNADQIWQYSNLQPWLIRCVQNKLNEAPTNQLLVKVDELCDRLFRWELSDFMTEAGNYSSLSELIKSRQWMNWRAQQQGRTAAERKKRRQFVFTMDLLQENRHRVHYEQVHAPWQIAISATLYLQNWQLHQATEAYSKILKCSYAHEMKLLTEALAMLISQDNLAQGQPFIALPRWPSTVKHQQSWQALTLFNRIVHYVWLYRRCNAETKEIVREIVTLDIDRLRFWKSPHDEATIIRRIAEIWCAQLEDWYLDQHRLQLSEITDPFIYQNPLYNKQMFIGRQTLLRHLYRANTIGTLRPICLWGLPRVGKTSLLNRLANTSALPVRLAIVNLTQITRGTNLIQQVVLSICQSIAHTTSISLQSTHIADPILLRHPLRYLQEYIHSTCHQLGNESNNLVLTLALDDFDELLIRQHSVSNAGNAFSPRRNEFAEFLDLLWHLVSNVERFNVVFAMKQPPERLGWTKHLIFDAVLCLHVNNLGLSEAMKLLQEPTINFVPQFTPEAVNQILRLLGGQPFLLQLLGSCLVQRFNQRIRINIPTDPLFTPASITEIQDHDQEFQMQCVRYFQTLLHYLRAACLPSEPVLHHLATIKVGFTHEELLQTCDRLNLSIENLTDALEFLQICQITILQENQIRIRSGMFYHWLQQGRIAN